MAASDKPVTVNDETFERWVLQSDLPVALLFCTPKFAKCQQIEPLWQWLAKEYAGRLRVVQVVVDENRQWARRYRVEALPATFWLRDGEIQQRAEGLPDEAELRERAEALLAGREQRLSVFQESRRVSETRRVLSSAGGPVTLTDATFDDALKVEKPVLVDFWAAWCGPCRMVAPVVEQLAREMEERALVAKLNIDENPRTAQRFNVMSIPTLLIFKRGRVADTIIGAQPGQVIRQRLMAQF
ncbi:MAG: thioredoxin [Ardenticatenaceae bacterium]